MIYEFLVNMFEDIRDWFFPNRRWQKPICENKRLFNKMLGKLCAIEPDSVKWALGTGIEIAELRGKNTNSCLELYEDGMRNLLNLLKKEDGTLKEEAALSLGEIAGLFDILLYELKKEVMKNERR